MIILFNSPILAIIFALLVVCYFKVDNNKYGRYIGVKDYKNIKNTHKNNVVVVDIRNENRIKAMPIANSVTDFHNKDYLSMLNKGVKIVIAHDSDVDLAVFFNNHRLPFFHKDIYQLNLMTVMLLMIKCQRYQDTSEDRACSVLG